MVVVAEPVVSEAGTVVTDSAVVAPVAAVVPEPGAEVTVELLRAAVEAELDRTAAPRALYLLDELPRRGPGKVDRRALATRVTNIHQ